LGLMHIFKRYSGGAKKNPNKKKHRLVNNSRNWGE